MTYLRARVGEISTWIGISAIGLALVAAWHWHATIWHWIAAAAGTLSVALPGRFLRSAGTCIADAIAETVKNDLPRDPAKVATEEQIMPLDLSPWNLLTSLPDFTTAASDANALAQAFQTGGLKAAAQLFGQQQSAYAAVLKDLGVSTPDVALVAQAAKLVKDAAVIEAAGKANGIEAILADLPQFNTDLVSLVAAIKAAQTPAAAAA